MILKTIKIVAVVVGFVIAIPIIIILGVFSYLYIISAFPSNSFAAEGFEENGSYEFPKTATNIYFRVAMPSPLDRGGSALRFSAETPDLLKISKSVPPGLKWEVLEDEFVCN